MTDMAHFSGLVAAKVDISSSLLGLFLGGAIAAGMVAHKLEKVCSESF